MANVTVNNDQEEWLKVLGKGMITLPKKWREEMGIENGDVVKAKKEGNTVVIEPRPQMTQLAPYRIYSEEEIAEFLAVDEVPDSLQKDVQKKLATSSNP